MVLYAMEVMLEYRNRGLATFWSGPTAVQIDRINVDDNFLRLAQVVELFPDKHDFVQHKMVVYTLVRPIPRVFWPGKPTDPGFDLAELAGVQGASLSASVVAEWFASGGFIAVVLGGLLYGVLARAGSVVFSGAAATCSGKSGSRRRPAFASSALVDIVEAAIVVEVEHGADDRDVELVAPDDGANEDVLVGCAAEVTEDAGEVDDGAGSEIGDGVVAAVGEELEAVVRSTAGEQVVTGATAEDVAGIGADQRMISEMEPLKNPLASGSENSR